MPRRLRKIYDTTDAVELTFTTAERRFYLRPNKLVNAIIAGVVAVAAERYEVGVIAVVALSSHMHLIAKVFRDVEQQALFAQFVEANIATEINRLLGRTRPVTPFRRVRALFASHSRRLREPGGRLAAF
jgi:REP element-mobilizing transposase RayT